MRKLTINNKIYPVPGSWDEMTSKQFCDVIRASVYSVDIPTFKLVAIFALIGLKVKKQDPIIKNKIKLFALKHEDKSIYLLSPDQLVDMLDIISFVFEKDKEGNELDYINSKRTLNPIKSLKLKHKRYYGPEDRLFNLSMEEFITAETHYMNFLNDQNNDHLDCLCASLYRPRNPKVNPKSFEFKGDLREPFNDHSILNNSKLFQRVDLAMRFAIFYWYQGCREFLTFQFPNVFNSTTSKKKDNFGMMSLVDALAKEDVTKNEQIRKTSLYDVLLRLERAAILRQEMEQKLKK